MPGRVGCFPVVQKWRFPLSCLGLVIISLLPLYTEVPYDPRNTQDVIFSIFSVSLKPYRDWGWVFHAATLLLVLFILWKPDQAGRVLAGYIAVNYLIIAVIQPYGVTEKYGFALQTGAMVGTALIGIVWLVAAIQNNIKISLHNIPGWRYGLLPLALFVFWSPVKAERGAVLPNFDLRLLLTSVDYGLTYCFVTPVFLFLLILFSTNQESFAFRILAFNALLYGLFNLTHWFNPNTVWMGGLHLPLLILSLVGLFLSRLDCSFAEKRKTSKRKKTAKTLTGNDESITSSIDFK
jgi:hypothetical protein